jgi:hypothetical protein
MASLHYPPRAFGPILEASANELRVVRGRNLTGVYAGSVTLKHVRHYGSGTIAILDRFHVFHADDRAKPARDGSSAASVRHGDTSRTWVKKQEVFATDIAYGINMLIHEWETRSKLMSRSH